MHPTNQNTSYLGLLIITLVMIGGGFYAVHLPSEQAERGHWMGHTREVIDQLDKLELHVNQAETGQRGYLLTAQDSFLAPYDEALQLIGGDITTARDLTADNQIQQDRLSALQKQIAEKLASMKETVDLQKAAKPEDEKKSSLSRADKEQMDTIHQQIGEMRAEEESLLKARSVEWGKSIVRTRATLLIAGALVYVLICAVYFILRREIRERRLLAEAEQRIATARQAETERLTQIVMIQREVTGNDLDLQKVLETIIDRLQDLTSAEGAIVEMLEDNHMVYRAANGLAAPHVGIRMKAQGSLSGLCVKQNAVLKCDDSETDSRVDRAACRRVGLRSMVVVPLRHHGDSVGVLKVLSSKPNGFSSGDVAMLELLAAVLSAVLSDAVAADNIRHANEQLTSANEKLAIQTNELQHANAKLEELATTDGLTGLKNHRAFRDRLNEEFQRAARNKTTLSLLLLDVDNFKTFNDSFGHPAGDAVLKRVAAALQATARMTDCVARYGGEEFALLLPETGIDGAKILAERVRLAVANAVWEKRPVTVSIGASTTDADIPNAAALLEAADQALYVSKNGGRNRVTAGKAALPA